MENNTALSPQKKDELIDELLIFMKNEAENYGDNISGIHFDFHLEFVQKYFGDHTDETIPEGNDLAEFKKVIKITDEEFKIVMNCCQTHKYVKKACIGRNNFDYLMLTDSGLARANSAEKAKYYKPEETIQDNSSQIVINGPVNATNFQAGNNNTQNITDAISYFVEEINKADATEDEKKTVLQKFDDFLRHPIVAGI